MADDRDVRGRFAAKPRDELSAAYRRRLERGERKRRSLAETRGHGVTGQRAWQSRSAMERENYRKALDVLVHMRHGESLYRAASEVHTTPDSVRRYVGQALTRTSGGRFTASPVDHFYRRMKFLDSQGRTTVEPANSREASKLARYESALKHYLQTGDDHQLRRFRKMRLRTRNKLSLPFLTDLGTLDFLARAGELSFEDLYELAA